ncbi:MAG: sigma-70 family RNA polymerase sigma factor [Bacteroidetes bacterium]|nr:sigma-70 family RNA polymerase sigma factor [Bacteroidota bacterium]
MSNNSKYSSYTDNDLINTFLEKDDNNIVGVLYERYGHLVLGLCIKYLKNKDEAQDAVIQIFTNLLKDLKKYKIEFFKSWLYVYSKNFCLMELRKRQSALKKELELKENVHLIMDYSNPEHLNEKEKQITIMEKALELLNIEQKKCIDLFYLKNKSYVEIVDMTGYTANEVKSHIQNGKRNLKIKMETLINEEPGTQ